MKKITKWFLVAAIAILPAISFAQTSPSVQALLDQIKALQTQLESLKTAQTNVQSIESDIKESLKLIRNLRQGMSGDDVKALQAILAADSSVYPEGQITGYYGALTSKAVRMFQKKYGIEQVGNVGPKTLKKLNEELEKNKLSLEDDDSSGTSTSKGKRVCAKIPPGHLIAKGWLKKEGNDRPIVPECQKLPKGIEKKLPGTGTSTPDTTAPVISGVTAVDISNTSATVKWNTNENATAKVWYSTSTVSTSTASSVNRSSLKTSHSLTITGLSANTVYYYIVESVDAAGNKTSSSQSSFTTNAVTDTTAPVISNVSATVAATSSVVTWTTNESANSKVWWSTTNPVDFAGNSSSVNSSTLVTSHSLNIGNLATSTTYYYAVVSADASGNTATSSQSSFTTLSQ